MCGISGFVTFDSRFKPKERLKCMTDLILHRGPDGYGNFIGNESSFTIAMGMRRLSVIDLQSGNQPIFSEDKNKVIVFNGEIYNYKILKEELIHQGCTFETKSDTEVILKLYEKKGVDSFAKLDGMFAFSIYDKILGKVFIARDFFGEKPLYYTNTSDGFYWASELKSIVNVLPYKPEIDKMSLSIYFQTTYIPAPYTIYKGIQKLEPNHYIELDCSRNNFSIIEIERPKKKYEQASKKECVKHVHDLVWASVNSRSISDVPLGTFLSGGVDSSIVSLCLAQQQEKKIDTFSIGFYKTSFDESDKSRLVSKLINSNHHEFIMSEKDIINIMDEIILNFDEPFADSSSLATYLVSKKTKEYVKVALTGDGGDEVFGGYNKYYIGKLNEKYTSVVPQILHKGLLSISNTFIKNKNDKRGIIFKVNRLINSIDYESDFYYKIISLGFDEKELQSFLKSAYFENNSLRYFKNIIGNNNKTINDFRNIDKLLSLEGDMLVKVDRSSMLASLECRSPFLNKELWNFASQLPSSYLINGWDKKHILKEAFKDYFPKNFLNKPKKGFGVPVGDWLRSILRLELLSYIDKDFLIKQNIFNYEPISKLVHNHLYSKVDNTFKVWSFYCFQKWYKATYEA